MSNLDQTSILLVDDHPFVREGIRSFLSDLPEFKVVGEASSGAEAVKLAQQTEPDFILLDLNMPLMDGRQFLRAVNKKAELADIPVIVVSTSSDNVTREETKALGAMAFFTKPDKLSGWMAMVNSILKNPEQD